MPYLFLAISWLSLMNLPQSLTPQPISYFFLLLHTKSIFLIHLYPFWGFLSVFKLVWPIWPHTDQGGQEHTDCFPGAIWTSASMLDWARPSKAFSFSLTHPHLHTPLTHPLFHIHTYTSPPTHPHLHVYTYTSTLTCSHLHIPSYTPTLTHPLLHIPSCMSTLHLHLFPYTINSHYPFFAM